MAAGNLPRFPSTLEISLGLRPREISWVSGNLLGVGDGFPNTSLVLMEHGYKAAQKASCAAGQVPGKKRSEPFRDDQLAKCWDGGSLGRGNPRALAATVHLVCMSQLGFRSMSGY